jgi:hypothetical protein
VIFHSPLRVDTTLEHREADAKQGYDQGTWLVHSGEFPEIDVGMVSDGHGFEDSPDCERIAGGVNSKGPMAVAIGRQANLLQWGFYGAPDRMSAPAKRAFLNAIVWMKQFAGQRPLADKQAQARTWFVQYIDMLARQSPAELAKTDERSLAGYLRKRFPAELVQDGVDVAKLRAWYDANEEFFGPGEKGHSCAVDADLAALQLSNRKPEFLDWLLQALAADATDARALRLARRYLGEHGRDAAAAQAFVTGNREFLFFSDTAGFRWLVDENRRRAAAKASAPR